MNAEGLLRHFGRVSEAPGAVPRLRRFVLDLAVRGKLVPQVAGDEGASVLLGRVEEEKRLLIREGAIRKTKPLDSIDEADLPFEVPNSWAWARLIGLVTKLTDGTHHSPPNSDTGEFKYITAKNIKSDGVSLKNVTYVSRAIHEEIYSRCNPEKGDILYIKDGATTGVVTINDLDEPFSMLSSVALLKPSSAVANTLIVLFLRSPFFYEQMRSLMKGAAITRVTLKRMSPALVPLPPLAEQHRIVAKVDELMALCDELEAAQTAREKRRDRLVAVVHHRLGNGDDDGESGVGFKETARFFFNHLPRLTVRVEHIRQLRQTILDLAVRGRLVGQVAGDEGAPRLLEKIADRRDSLIESGVVRKSKPLPLLPEDEVPFEAPPGWIATRLGIVYDVRDGTHDTPKYVGNGYPLVTSKNLSTGKLTFTNVKYIGEQDYLQISRRSRVDRGDILLAMIGSIGNPVIVDTDREFSIKNVALFKYFAHDLSCPGYLCLFLQHTTSEMRQQAAGGLQPFVSLGFLRKYPMLLPPLSEQHRIVAKVDELMEICDEVESSLETGSDTSRQFIESIFQAALNRVPPTVDMARTAAKSITANID